MLSYICNGGRLGENISYIYGLFKFCKNNNVPFDNIVIDYNYKNKSLLKDKPDDYVFHNSMEMFSNIRENFKRLNPTYFSDFNVIDICARTDITLFYNFYKYNDNYNIETNILFKDYWSLDDYFRLKDPTFDRKLLEYICRPKRLVNRLIKEYCDILTNDCIGIHIRREDYVGLENNSILKESVRNNMNNFYKHKKLYLKDDIDKIIREHKKNNILIFSDDIDWCRNNFEIYKNVNIIDGNKPYEDMILLSLCSKVIKNPGSFFSQISYILNENNNV